MRINYLIFLLCVSSFSLCAQGLKGALYSDSLKTPIEFASLHWMGTKVSVQSDMNGKFSIAWPDSFPALLIISHVEFGQDTFRFRDKKLSIVELRLQKVKTLGQIDITEKKDGNFIAYSPIKTEIITIKELTKMACCNLGESFETNASVDVTYKDAITGSKEIQILGLSGAYTLMLSENAPLLTGLSQTYGLNSIPGNQIAAINIVKGPGSVIFGHEAMAGMVNVELKDPMNTNDIFVNAYLDNDLRKELNIDKKWKINDHLSTLLMVHADHSDKKEDFNEDGFMDMPMITSLSLTNKWKYLSNKGSISQNTIKYMYEERMGGQTAFDHTEHHTDTNLYGQKLSTGMLEFNGRTGLALKAKKESSIGFQYSGFLHTQKGYYGKRAYEGTELNGNLRLILNVHWKENHSLDAGLAYKYDDTEELFDTLLIKRMESTPGVFVENTFTKDQVVAFIAGVRADLYNGKVFITPRTSFKYSFTEHLDLRLNVGTGWKNAYILAENPGVLSSSKSIVINGELLPQESVNFGSSLVQKFKWFFRKGTFVVDAYHTEFRNMVIPNYDYDFTQVIFSNFEGRAWSNAVQAEFAWEIFKNLDLKLAWKFLDVQKEKDGHREELPFIARHRALATVFFETFNRKWNMTFTTQWFGEKRMPYTLFNPPAYQRPPYSDPYFKFNFQVNRIWKRHELYLGAENLLNFIQDDAIISAENPYGPYFDTSFIWGPLEGRKIYFGWRFHIEKQTVTTK